MAARRRKRAIWISCFHRSWRAFAGCPLRHGAMSAAYSRVRVTAGYGRPSAVQKKEKAHNEFEVLRSKKRLALCLLALLLLHWKMPPARLVPRCVLGLQQL